MKILVRYIHLTILEHVIEARLLDLAKIKTMQMSSYFEPKNRRSDDKHAILQRNGVQDVGQPLPFPVRHGKRSTDQAHV